MSAVTKRMTLSQITRVALFTPTCGWVITAVHSSVKQPLRQELQLRRSVRRLARAARRLAALAAMPVFASPSFLAVAVINVAATTSGTAFGAAAMWNCWWLADICSCSTFTFSLLGEGAFV